MSIFDLFNKGQQQANNKQAAQQQGKPANPGNLPDNAGQESNSNSGAEANGSVPPEAAKEAESNSQVDPFKGLWETTDTGDDELKLTAFSNEDLSKAAQKVNFMESADPQLLQQIANGGEEAVSAMSTLLNGLGQQVLAQAAGVSTQLTKRNIMEAIQGVDPKIQKSIRDLTSQDTLTSTNKKLQDPSIQPVVNAVRNQLLTKFPKATPQEISEMTTQYLAQIGAVVTPEPEQVKTPDDLDWDSWVESGQN